MKQIRIAHPVEIPTSSSPKNIFKLSKRLPAFSRQDKYFVGKSILMQSHNRSISPTPLPVINNKYSSNPHHVKSLVYNHNKTNEISTIEAEKDENIIDE